jgi:hypothetical protein
MISRMQVICSLNGRPDSLTYSKSARICSFVISISAASGRPEAIKDSIADRSAALKAGAAR